MRRAPSACLPNAEYFFLLKTFKLSYQHGFWFNKASQCLSTLMTELSQELAMA